MPNDPDGARNAYNSLKLAMVAALNGEDASPDNQEVAKTEDVKPADQITNVEPLDDTTTKPSDNVEVTPSDKPAEAADVNLPTFDVLRVEKDGSTVIAGHATSRVKIDILDGDTVIASTQADDAGDFVIVLDNPLPAGDHQIVIQATDSDGKKAVSVEVATVSVPKDASGQLLAMVTKPGEPSRIMEMPESTKDTSETVVAKNSDQNSDQKTPDATQDVATDAKTDAVEPKKGAVAIAEMKKETVEPKQDAEPVDIAKPADVVKTEEAKTDAKPVVTPDLPAASNDLANNAPVVKQDAARDTAKADDTSSDIAKPADTAEVAKADTAKTADSTEVANNDTVKTSDKTDIAASKTADAAKNDAAAEAKNTDQLASSNSADATKPDANAVKPVSTDSKPIAKTVTAPEVVVSAVEIEGSKIFVAGGARPKSVVRVYADDKLVAEISTDENGRFVADSSMPLAVGNHTIRADVLSSDGKKVEFRASVPFFRPEGEQLAAVASNDATPDKQEMQPIADGAYDHAREEAGKAIGLLKGLYVAGRTPTLDELAAARSATEIALKTLSQIKLTDGDDPVAKQMADKTAGNAAKALALLKSLPQDANAVKTALNSIDDAVTSAVAPAVDTAAAHQPATATDKEKAADDTVSNPAVADQSAKSENTEMVNKSAKSNRISASTTKTDIAAQNAAKDKADDTTKTAQAIENKAASTSDHTSQALVKQGTEVASADSQPKLIEQAPLKPSETSVIIRRGDTLWQISRRVYGRGVRYTTIYVANEDQITDPDRIMPGQIFGVPDKFLPNSEELHRQRMGHKKN
jgi:nucleoid-associated protein YgaU